MPTKTKSILGYKLTLEIGKRYLATRPMLHFGITRKMEAKLPVSIVNAENPFGQPVAFVGNMTYDDAIRFLNAFNNGKMTFDGRVW